jgi:hypothetical protein
LFEAGLTGQMIETIAQRGRNRQKPNPGMVEKFAVLRSNKILGVRARRLKFRRVVRRHCVVENSSGFCPSGLHSDSARMLFMRLFLIF